MLAKNRFTDPIKYLYIYNIQGYIGSNIFNDVVLRLCDLVSTAIWVCLLYVSYPQPNTYWIMFAKLIFGFSISFSL